MDNQNIEQPHEAPEHTNDRLERIESMLENIVSQMNQVPSLIAIATDTIDEGFNKTSQSGVQIEERVQNGMSLITRLSDPNISKSMHQLLDFIELAPGLIALSADMVDESVHKANAQGINVSDRISTLSTLLETLSRPEMSDKLSQLVAFSDQAPGLAAMAVDSIDDIMRKGGGGFDLLMSIQAAVTNAQAEAPAKVGGIFGLMKAIKDPDRQKALGFFMNILKQLGKQL